MSMPLPGLPPMPPPPSFGPAGAQPPPPPAGLGGGPDPAMLVPALANALGIPPEELAQLLASLRPDQQELFLSMPFQDQLGLLQQLLAQLGVQSAPPNAPPVGDLGPPSPPPPDAAMMGGPPPGMGAPPPPPPPMPGGPAPIAMMPDGSMSMMPPPPQGAPPAPPAPPPVELQLLSAQEAVGMETRKPRRKVEPPKQRDLARIKKRSPYGDRPMTWEEVNEAGLRGPEVYAGRDRDIDLHYEVYHLINRRNQLDGTPTEPLAGELWHTWNKGPVVMDQIVGAVAPHHERLIIQNDPWDDTAECEESAQHIENYYRSQLRRCAKLWNLKGTRGDPQPPFDRTVALIAALEGGLGWRFFCDPDEPGMFFMEPVPLRQMYTYNGMVVRVLEMTLDEARAHYQDIAKAWPVPRGDRDGRKGKAYPAGDEKMRFTVAADQDGLWECIAYDWAAPQDAWYGGQAKRKAKKDTQWVKAPVAIDYGFCPLDYPPLWFGSTVSGNTAVAPADHSGIDLDRATPGDQRLRLRHRSVFTPLVEQIHLGSQLMSIIATGANLVTNPPMIVKINPNNPTDYTDPQDGKGKRRNPSRRIGAISQLYTDESFEPVPVDPSALQNLQAMLNLIMSQTSDVARPVLGGGGDAASGADRYLAQGSAEDHIVAPLRRYLVERIEWGLECLGAMAWRKGKGKQQLYTSLPYRAGGRTPLRDAQRPANGMGGAVLPEDFARQGNECRVRYRIEDPIRLQQLMSVYLPMMKEGAIDMFGFRDAMQVEDLLQMDRRVMRDQALGDEALKKARIGQALLDYHKNGGDLTLPLLYFQERLRENQSKGSAPAPVGMGSPPSPGTPMPGQAPALPGMGG